jgi:hypothetical protein
MKSQNIDSRPLHAAMVGAQRVAGRATAGGGRAEIGEYGGGGVRSDIEASPYLSRPLLPSLSLAGIMQISCASTCIVRPSGWSVFAGQQRPTRRGGSLLRCELSTVPPPAVRLLQPRASRHTACQKQVGPNKYSDMTRVEFHAKMKGLRHPQPKKPVLTAQQQRERGV